MYNPSDPIMLCDTTNIDNETWLRRRKHGNGESPADDDYIPYTIGGSDVPIVLGLSPWTSTSEFRDIKMGIIEKEDSSSDATDSGHASETFVAINFLRYMAKEYPSVKVNLIKDCIKDIKSFLKNACPDEDAYKEFCGMDNDVIKDFNKKWKYNPSAMYQCGTRNDTGELAYPFALANIDGLVEVNGRLGIFEAKTTSYERNKKTVSAYWQKGLIPPYYYWQLIFYMAVMNLDFAYITCTWGMTLADTAVILLERDLSVEENLMNQLADFVNGMVLGLPLKEENSNYDPLSKFYARKYGPAKGKEANAIELPEECGEYIKAAADIDRQISDLETAIANLREERNRTLVNLYPYMQDNSYATLTTDTESYGVKLKTPCHRASFNEEAFKNDHPDLYDQFSEPAFNVKLLEKADPAMKTQYMKPGEIDTTKSPTFEVYVKEAS